MTARLSESLSWHGVTVRRPVSLESLDFGQIAAIHGASRQRPQSATSRHSCQISGWQRLADSGMTGVETDVVKSGHSFIQRRPDWSFSHRSARSSSAEFRHQRPFYKCRQGHVSNKWLPLSLPRPTGPEKACAAAVTQLTPSFDFLGYTIGRFYGKDGAPYIGTRPSRKAVRRLLKRVKLALLATLAFPSSASRRANATSTQAGCVDCRR